ncbi:hypothetical protein [Radiobacillus deserti]|uniref:Uncharacterized protein n=1 Tax=Radiobacillus deserti TaxID=2594883 RepID=A0A516KKP2_9BACI|nr:hypothetical protein [Radiobacillus deserti]QDP41955.1 hypothetical protein FN924_18340 [Radiobacillus deserti]
MDQNQCVLMDQKKQINLKVEKATFYLQGQIIEAFNEKNEVYYLFFYKHQFLTAAKAKKLRRQSYIEHAFKEGIIFNSPHPLVDILLSSNQPLQKVSFQPLLEKLDKHYSPQEKASILTFFESFISKKRLFTEITSVYYEYRRNGQYFSAYRIIRILMDFAPNSSTLKSLASDMNFKKYAALYNQESEEILEKDIIFAEKVFYSQKENDTYFHQLEHLLEQDSRWMDLMALYIYRLTSTPSNTDYAYLLRLLNQYVNENEAADILEALCPSLDNFLPLQQDLLNKYMETRNVQKIFDMIQQYNFTLNDSSTVRRIGTMLEELDIETSHVSPDILPTLLKPYVELFPVPGEKLLYTWVISLMKTHELSYIQKWLKPLKENPKHLQIFGKMNTMERIYNDPDEMQTLGELYYEFKQLDKAIECFSWEMELDPTSPKPPHWLAKTYRDKGMNYESDAYQQLSMDLQKGLSG